jgi:hypothetical protein
MKKEKCYENYPIWMVAVTTIFSLAIYLLGAYVMYQLGLIWLAAYLVYIFLLEIRLIKGHCVDCYYYGKYCAFGRGKLACLFFKKRKKTFGDMKVTWLSIVPDLFASIAPIIAGIWLLIVRFDWAIVGAIVLLFLLMSVGNAFVRGSIACKYCKQRQLGCPAEQLFAKKK